MEPLSLKSTAIRLNADQLRRLAPGHDRFLEPVETWETVAMPASGSLRSTTNDLLNFLAFNLGEQESSLYAAMLYQRTPVRSRPSGKDVGAILNSMAPIHSTGALRCAYATAA